MRRSVASALTSPELPSGGSAATRKPKHQKVLETLMNEISSGRLRPGDRMPTEAELVKTFSFSRTTIARAMRELKGKGFLHRKHGGGTRLAQQEDASRLALFAPFADTATNLGFIGSQIYTHLADIASQCGDHLRLQFMGRTGGTLLEQMLSGVDELREKGVKGVFFYPFELPEDTIHYNQLAVDKLREAGVAVVLVDRDVVAYPQRSGLPLVTYDNRRGAYLVTNHLIKCGCKRIVFMGIPYISSAVADRMRGYNDALEDNGLYPDRSLIRRANLDDLDRAFCQTLIEETKADAIVCKMDHYAAVVGRHLTDMGLKIGRDIMLAGFDNQAIAEVLPVPLTTIRFPMEPFAMACYETLLKQLGNARDRGGNLTLIDVELVIRESTAPAQL